uniref:ACT domain-containing protein ACR12 isoform X1 n=1 Tax=Rhizophora mucronata TaxID=61149 RepID=A0A2P2KQM8_RHIMU
MYPPFTQISTSSSQLLGCMRLYYILAYVVFVEHIVTSIACPRNNDYLCKNNIGILFFKKKISVIYMFRVNLGI